MDMILNKCLNAVHEMTRHGGFAPAKWVLSRLPHSLATMGDEDEWMWVLCKHMLMDQQPSVYSLVNRAKACEVFVRWDCDERVRRDPLRNGRARGWILPSWRHSFILQGTTSV